MAKKFKITHCFLMTFTIILTVSCTHNVVGTLPTLRGTLVNISAIQNDKDNPVSVMLEAGIYTVSVVGTEAGGAFDAWKSWIYNPVQEDNGTWKYGWLNKYSYKAPDGLEQTIFDGIIYGTAEEAFNAALDSTFILSTPGLVDF